jgi:small subunit ribosomal protein S8
MVNDSISDLLTRIRNASMVQQASVTVPYTRLGLQICEILEKEGYINSYQLVQPNAELSDKHSVSVQILIRLKYRYLKTLRAKMKQSCITNLRRISKPGLRIYTNSKDIPRILGGTGIVILSTPDGLMTDRDARLSKLGGEILCSVW